MNALRALLSVLAVLFGGGFVVLLVVAIRSSLRFRAWRNWKRAPAVVTSVDWEPVPAEPSRGVLLIVIDVEGRMSTSLDVGTEPHAEEEREKLIERFAVGTRHEALVDPSGATPPLLITGLLQQPVAPLIIGSIFLVLAGVMAGLVGYLGQPDNVLSRLLG